MRSYAEAVGLDGKQLLEQYIGTAGEADGVEEGSQPTPEPVQEADPTPQRVKPSRTATKPTRLERPTSVRLGERSAGRGKTYWGETAAVVAILAVVGAAWWLIGGPGKGHSDNAGLSTLNQTDTVHSGASNASSSSNATNAPGNTSNPGNQTGNAPGSTSPASKLQVVSQTFSGGEQTFVVATADPLTVQLQDTQSCWLQTWVDQKLVDPSETLNPPAQRTWTGNQTVRIRLGFPPGVRLTVNGQSLSLPNTNSPIYVTVTKGQAQ
ncbi:XRE family transcriptional regulator [Alicyclobacillus contaminans]|nr:XRE family transcriptional regulator [Alicyclobacillus contaminans]